MTPTSAVRIALSKTTGGAVWPFSARYARAVDLLEAFNTDVLVVAIAILLALATFKLTQWVPVPAPALLLIAAAIASDIFPELGINVATVERIGSSR